MAVAAVAAAPLSLAAISLAIASVAIYQLLFALILLLLPKHAVAARVASLAPLSAAAYAVARHAIARAGPVQRQAPLLGLLMVHWLGLAEYVLLSRVDSRRLSELAAQGRAAATSNGKEEKTAGDGQATLGRQLWQALALSCNARRIGTEWEVKNVYRRRGAATRAAFLAHVVPRIALCYLVVDALMLAPEPEPRLVTREKQTAWRLWTLTPEDVGFRAAATACFALIAYCLIYVIVHVAAVVSVVLGMSTPAFWPRLFGPLSELRTLRGFWGAFWHQRLRRPLTAFVDVIADHVLLVPRSGVASKYTRLFLAFALSGLLHHPTDTVQGLPATETATLAFWLMQPVGIAVENAAQALTRGWPLPRGVRSVAGYAWVAFFMVCTTPTWMFSIARLGQTPDLLPFRVAKPLLTLLTGE